MREEKQKIKSYRDLIAWQKGYRLCLTTYKSISSFPKNEEYGISSQIKRSAVSIPSNIAEGYARHSTKEFIRYLYFSFASLAELETQISIAKDLTYIKNEVFEKIQSLITELQVIIKALIKSLKNKKSHV